jgi:hypothetical protein
MLKPKIHRIDWTHAAEEARILGILNENQIGSIFGGSKITAGGFTDSAATGGGWGVFHGFSTSGRRTPARFFDVSDPSSR